MAHRDHEDRPGEDVDLAELDRLGLVDVASENADIDDHRDQRISALPGSAGLHCRISPPVRGGSAGASAPPARHLQDELVGGDDTDHLPFRVDDGRGEQVEVGHEARDLLEGGVRTQRLGPLRA